MPAKKRTTKWRKSIAFLKSPLTQRWAHAQISDFVCLVTMKKQRKPTKYILKHLIATKRIEGTKSWMEDSSPQLIKRKL